MKRAARIAIVATVVIASTAAYAWHRIRERASRNQVLVSGTVEATEAELGFQVSGRLEKVNAREGDLVHAGAELAVLDQSELLAEREVARAQVAAAQALLAEYLAGSRQEEIARARAQLSVAENRRDAAVRDRERFRALAQKELISRQAFDHTETDAHVAEGEVNQAREELQLLKAGTRPERIAAQRAALAQAQATLAGIEAVIRQSVVVAPFEGTVTVRHREPGEAVGPGGAVVTLQNLDDRWVRVYVPGDEVGRLMLGQCAEIEADGFADRRYTGVVSYIARVAEFTPRNVQSTKDRVRLVYEVRVRITGDDSVDLKPGLPGDVTFRVAGAGEPGAIAVSTGSAPAPCGSAATSVSAR